MYVTTLSSSSRNPEIRHRAWFDPEPARSIWNLDVLLVDDDAADISLILGGLKRHPHVMAARAISAGDVALLHLSTCRSKPDLVLLDIHMPRMDGFEFLKRMRKIEGMADTPVVFLTTSGQSKDVIEAKHSSAQLYLIKPDTFQGLILRLDAVIARAMLGAWSK